MIQADMDDIQQIQSDAKLILKIRELSQPETCTRSSAGWLGHTVQSESCVSYLSPVSLGRDHDDTPQHRVTVS